MPPEIIAPAAFVFLAAVIIIYTQLIAPGRARRCTSLCLTRRGWMRVPPDRDYTWTDIMTLAIEDQHGASRVREYDRTLGPFTVHVKRTENLSGKALELYRDTGASQLRYAALGIRKETVLDSQRSRFPFLGSKKKKNYTSRELWIGEARRIPVDKPEKVYNAINEIYGRSLREMASDRGVHPDSIPLLAPPSEGTPARAVRELLKKTHLSQGIMASVYLGPAAWVLLVPLRKVGRHIEDIVVLTGEISQVIDRHARGEALDPAPNEDENRAGIKNTDSNRI
jgi:hypothetical protein